MCIAIPVRLVKVSGSTGIVKFGSIYNKINIALVPDVEEGDYVLIHSGCALQKIDEVEAEKTLDLLKNLGGR